jgi:hypothetical protein
MVLGAWCLVLGAWCLVLGAWMETIQYEQCVTIYYNASLRGDIEYNLGRLRVRNRLILAMEGEGGME